MLIAIALALFAVPGRAATTIVRLSADHVSFYYDRYLVEADGNVRVTTSDGLTITGQSFSMDLKLNRFLVAGAVRLDAPTGSQTGAAVADFLDFNRVYFVPITTEPDRWTFLDGDYSHPVKGREMPGDTFEFPDLENDRPYLNATSAAIGAKSYVRFGGTVLTFNGAPVAPVGTYYIGFSSNKYMAQNSLAGATYDATWQIAGTANGITALHFRYDPVNHVYASFEQHFATDNAYAVFSVNPGTQPSKFWNLVAGYQPTPKFQISDFTQLHTYQYGLNEPLEAQAVSTIQASQLIGAGTKSSALSLSWQGINYCLLQAQPNGLCGAPDHRAILDNTQTWTLGFQTYDYRVSPYTPLYLRGNFGFGFIHDTQPLQFFGPTIDGVSYAVPYTTIWNHYAGVTAYVPNIRFGDRNVDPKKSYYVNLSINAGRQWYSLPHHVDTIDGLGSLSRFFGNAVSTYLAYEVRQTSDLYNAGQQAYYPTYTPTIGTQTYPSYAAFQGLATQRTLSLGMNYAPNPEFSFSLLARKHNDFPIAEPGLFIPPPTNNIGQYLYTNYLGQPPYDITGDLRFRLFPHAMLDIQRTYFFNFGTERWSPQFVIQVLPGV